MHPSLGPWHAAARRLLPNGINVWDAHTHTGQNDPDGVTKTAAELVADLDAAGHAGAVLITNADPAGYDAPNARILAEAEASAGRLIPFVRVDPRQPRAAAAVTAGLAAGHRGVKLHPRSESFAMDDPAVAEVCRAAAAGGAPVLVHSGRGIPSLGAAAIRLVESIDGLRLILAHCAISDLARLGPVAAEHPRLYFDTAWWNMTDHLALAAWVPPGRILYASDTPYGATHLGFTLAMRTATAVGYDDRQLAAHFGGTLHRLLDGTDGEDLGAPPGDGFICADAGLLRVHAALHAALGAAYAGTDASEATALARQACAVPVGEKDEEVYRAIAATIDTVDPTTRRGQLLPLILAAAAALTPQVAVPNPAEIASG